MTLSRITLGGAVVLPFLFAHSLALADCFVDSAGGNDSAQGDSDTTPVASPSAAPSSCTVVRFKRGSRFEQALSAKQGVTYTNYGDASQPLPIFRNTSGSVVSSFNGGISVNGLHFEGSRGDGSMGGVGGGTCVMLGGGSQLLNSEITDCDIGIMLFGDGSLVQGNVVYDLSRMAVDSEDTGVYANAVGGAEAIFINGSNNEVAYNQFINCKAEADWQAGANGSVGYDGGATEVAVSEGSTVSGLKVHHNFSYNSCGFFEVSGFGTFSDSEFYYNVSVDSAWLMLLQVNETTLSNIRFENNTVVHHADSYSPSIAMIYQAELTPGTVTLQNNLFIFDGAQAFNATIDSAFTDVNNVITSSDPGVANLKGTAAADFDLLEAATTLRDQGVVVAGHTLDFLNRTAPDSSGKTDIGAFEYGSAVGAELPATAEVPADTGATDTGATDTGATDTGATDTGATDTGTTSTGATDTGATSTGQTTTPGQTTPGQTTPGQTTPGQTTPGQTTPGQTTPGQTTPGQTTNGQAAGEESATSDIADNPAGCALSVAGGGSTPWSGVGALGLLAGVALLARRRRN